jgi:hypothetical protein
LGDASARATRPTAVGLDTEASFTVAVRAEDLAVLDAVDPERFLTYPLP